MCGTFQQECGLMVNFLSIKNQLLCKLMKYALAHYTNKFFIIKSYYYQFKVFKIK